MEGIPQPWDANTLQRRALELAALDTAEARLFALDAIDAQDLDVIQRLPLSETERDWLMTLGLAAKRRWREALRSLTQLPHDRYPEKCLIIGKIVSEGHGNEMYSELDRHLEPFVSIVPAASIVRGLLDLTPKRDLGLYRQGLRDLLEIATDAAGHQDPQVIALRAEAETLSGNSVEARGTQHPASPAAAVLYSLRSGTSLGSVADPALIGRLPESVADSLIDQGLLPPLDASEGWSTLSPYLRGRLRPDLLSDEDLDDLNFSSELGRRAFIAGDEELLRSQRGDPITETLVQLHSVRSGGPFEGNPAELLSDDDRMTLEQMLIFLDSPKLQNIGQRLLTDRSCWPTIAAGLPMFDPAEAKSLPEELSAFLAWKTLHDGRRRIFEWDWAGALDLARACLAVAREEPTRDEALNLLACAQWQLGNGDAAIQALETALEGDYNEALQTNIGVVAAQLRPSVAGEHLGSLAKTAPTLELRVAAAKRAIELWHADPEPWARDDEDAETLPDTLRTALRGLVVEPVDRDDFRELLHLLALWDSDWVSTTKQLSKSKHSDTYEARLWTARAKDFSTFVTLLAEGLQRVQPEWLVRERDRLVDAAIGALVADEPTLGAAAFGLQIVEANVPLEVARQVPLTAFSVAAVAANIDPSEGEPKEKFWTYLDRCTQLIDQLSGDARERAELALDYAYDRLARTTLVSRNHQYGEAVDTYNELQFRLRGTMPWNVNRDVVRRVATPMLEFVSSTTRLIDRALPRIEDEEFIQALQEFRQELASFGAAVRKLPGVY